MWLKKQVSTYTRAKALADAREAQGCLVVIVGTLNGYQVAWKSR
jgi:hypothetical protein